MFQALFLMCATVSGDDCVVVASPLYNTEQACTMDFENGLRQSVILQPERHFIEHRCIHWQSSFPNA